MIYWYMYKLQMQFVGSPYHPLAHINQITLLMSLAPVTSKYLIPSRPHMLDTLVPGPRLTCGSAGWLDWFLKQNGGLVFQCGQHLRDVWLTRSAIEVTCLAGSELSPFAACSLLSVWRSLQMCRGSGIIWKENTLVYVHVYSNCKCYFRRVDTGFSCIPKLYDNNFCENDNVWQLSEDSHFSTNRC